MGIVRIIIFIGCMLHAEQQKQVYLWPCMVKMGVFSNLNSHKKLHDITNKKLES